MYRPSAAREGDIIDENVLLFSLSSQNTFDVDH